MKYEGRTRTLSYTVTLLPQGRKNAVEAVRFAYRHTERGEMYSEGSIDRHEASPRGPQKAEASLLLGARG